MSHCSYWFEVSVTHIKPKYVSYCQIDIYILGCIFVWILLYLCSGFKWCDIWWNNIKGIWHRSSFNYRAVVLWTFHSIAQVPSNCLGCGFRCTIFFGGGGGHMFFDTWQKIKGALVWWCHRFVSMIRWWSLDWSVFSTHFLLFFGVHYSLASA